jgi:hypothetical protein
VEEKEETKENARKPRKGEQWVKKEEEHGVKREGKLS